jgi:outer membrane receptor for ferrienterochelin and colicin
VVTAEDLQQSGYTSVSDVLRNLASNRQGTLSQSFSQAFAGGDSGVALRGLTVGATLTLIDSERMIPGRLEVVAPDHGARDDHFLQDFRGGRIGLFLRVHARRGSRV